MIYFSVKETLFAISSFFLLGGFFGGIYNSFEIITAFLFSTLKLPITTFKKYIISNKSYNKTKQKKKFIFYKNIFDFVFIIICATFFVLFSYLFLDASVRIFALFFFTFGYILSYKFLSRLFLILTNITTEIIYKFISSLFSLFFYPLFLLARLIKKLFMPIINYAFFIYQKHKNKKIILKKLRTVENLYKI